jgi:hypothetical protein
LRHPLGDEVPYVSGPEITPNQEKKVYSLHIKMKNQALKNTIVLFFSFTF